VYLSPVVSWSKGPYGTGYRDTTMKYIELAICRNCCFIPDDYSGDVFYSNEIGYPEHWGASYIERWQFG